ncbi:hypothetical protein EVAR_32511_1 [Eumeta japonica]|uniref:RNase H type-1 domain-containing protein n=1 Tax=Eumeta variegata TaxID=151549 RepID=A0A4C1W909_EUMVA|nr:hypothetical protein EVAR_32511_1 [Eumeta japonica]
MFANDEILMFFGQSALLVKVDANRALAHVHCRGIKIKLRFAPSKRKMIVLSRKLKYNDAVEFSLDGKIRLFDIKDTFADRELEKPVYFGDLSHLAYVTDIGYESVNELDSQILNHLTVVGPKIYTNGSRINVKVSAALAEWRDGEETWYSTTRLDPFSTVFQAEMVALQRVIRRMRNGEDGLLKIFSDSSSCLEAGRPHKKMAADYNRFPLSYAKKMSQPERIVETITKSSLSGNYEESDEERKLFKIL